MRPVRFTGGDGLVGFEALVNKVVLQNEVPKNKTVVAYQLSNSGVAASGFTFGPLQWDLLGDHTIDDTTTPILTARTLFTKILTTATSNGERILTDLEVEQVSRFVTTSGGTFGTGQQELRKKVDEA